VFGRRRLRSQGRHPLAIGQWFSWPSSPSWRARYVRDPAENGAFQRVPAVRSIAV